MHLAVTKKGLYARKNKESAGKSVVETPDRNAFEKGCVTTAVTGKVVTAFKRRDVDALQRRSGELAVASLYSASLAFRLLILLGSYS